VLNRQQYTQQVGFRSNLLSKYGVIEMLNNQMQRFFLLLSAIFLLLCCSCQNEPPAVKPDKPDKPGKAGESVVLFQQQVLYDRRGTKINDILINPAALVINPTSSTVDLEISAEVLPEYLPNLDFVMGFPVLTCCHRRRSSQLRTVAKS
jgi:hypothetical protein